MKILKVIHGYPTRYNAGSEIYSQTLCHELAKQGHEVIVFTRQENAYKQEYSMDWEFDPMCQEIKICLINMAHGKDGYRHPEVDRAFSQLLDACEPDVVHVGHLNHLSTSLVFEANYRNIPVVFTLHDFWLMCPRGQFLQGIHSKTEDLYPSCDSQQDEKCAKQCYWRYFSSPEDQEDIKYWTNWVGKRMEHVREITSLVDLFIAPSRYLMNRFVKDFDVDISKIVYLDYGFQRERLMGRNRKKEKDFVFGYIGTHKQAKGIFHLLQAFKETYQNAQLKIWGAPVQPFTQSLQSYIMTMDPVAQSRIFWMGSYRNQMLIEEVFNHVDAIVVPSIWGENSPLVIHEALEAKVPIITADFGGMGEYVHHEMNGLLFNFRNPKSLAEQMTRIVSDPQIALKIGNGGYLQSDDRRIPSIQTHVEQVVKLYSIAIKQRKKHEDRTSRKTRPLAYHI
ncbi:MAG TPA: glycosyltransferase [Chlamydiales bacterium]|nr:glycosyltransferase [Chlamydiales bacterium]